MDYITVLNTIVWLNLDGNGYLFLRIGTIDLARNKLTKVDFQMFSDLRYTEVINLAENQVGTLVPSFLSGFVTSF